MAGPLTSRWPAWALDLDGVVWLGPQPVPGAADAIGALRAAGASVAFVTNSSALSVGAVEARLEQHGIDPAGAVLTSAGAVATLIEPGERVLVCGGEGLVEAVLARGAEAVVNRGADPGPLDVVVCGYWRDIDYDRLRWAVTSLQRGARLLASNDDATYPSDEGILPGGGATLAAVERAAGTRAVVAGKPHAPMAAWVRERLGPEGVVVGDRPDTDGLLARALDWDFALVLSGVTPAGEDVTPRPVIISPSLPDLVDRVLA